MLRSIAGWTFAATMLVCTGSPASAMEALLEQTPNAPYGQAVIWKSVAAATEGAQVARSDIQTLSACIVPTGTKAVIEQDKESGLWNVRVLEGDNRGCRGVVEGRYLYLVREDSSSAPPTAKPPAKKTVSSPPRPSP